MIRSRKGVVALPIKLAVSFMILALMVPPIMASIDDIHDGMDHSRLRASAEELGDLIELVGSKSNGYKICHQLDILEGDCLTVGGTEGHLLRGSSGDDLVCKILLNRPVCSDKISLYGTVIIELASDTEGVIVREI